MELLQLRYFYETAKNENFTHTATKYMVPSSSVSISIKKLETELGCTLFERTANKIRLNNNGHILQKALQTSLATLDEAVETLKNTEPEQSGEIFSSYCIYYLRVKFGHPYTIYKIDEI